MAAHSGLNSVEDGLVFYYDMQNTKKSWKGKPTTNTYPDIFTSQSMRAHTKHFWNGKNWVVDGTYTDPGIPGPQGVYLGKVAKHTSGALNNSWSGNSYGYMLRDITPQTAGNYYALSCWVYVSTDCDITAIPSTIEGEQTGEASLTSGELSSYNMSTKGTWQKLGKRAVSDGNTRYIPVYPRKTGVTDGSFSGFFMWGGVQVEEGSFASPLVPADDGVATRSSTEAVLDLTGNYDITPQNLAYNSDGSFEFDGVDDFITVTDFSYPNDWNDPFSLEAWVYIPTGADWHNTNNGTTSNSGTAIIGRGSYAGSLGLARVDTQQFSFIIRTSDGLYSRTFTNASYDTWYHLVGTYDGNTSSLYVNGVLHHAGVISGKGGVPDGGTWKIGGNLAFGGNNGRYGEGKIPEAKMYNKALTAAEVKQNFEANRTKYGI